jgi:5-methylcytosine-specific restriction protein B
VVASKLHIPVQDLQDIVDLLQVRQQIVFYGPPGTGKTFIAQALAKHLVGGDDPSRAQLVQFHPSYSYEDFFEGYRPAESLTGQAIFRLTPGPLSDLAAEASRESNRGTPYVLVIDEMNRANIAKVFGELYFLLEYRDESIRLQYRPGEVFRLPRNLFVIGTMNTADRSIAALDAALRRRFSFVELHPDEPPVRDVLASWLAANGKDDDGRAGLLTALNAAIDEQDRDFRLGPSYLMRADAGTEAGLNRVWRYDVLPQLEEHYYGRLSRGEVHQRFGLDALRRAIGRSGGAEADAPPADMDDLES